jgi:hypothetical protein
MVGNSRQLSETAFRSGGAVFPPPRPWQGLSPPGTALSLYSGQESTLGGTLPLPALRADPDLELSRPATRMCPETSPGSKFNLTMSSRHTTGAKQKTPHGAKPHMPGLTLTTSVPIGFTTLGIRRIPLDGDGAPGQSLQVPPCSTACVRDGPPRRFMNTHKLSW